MVAQPEDFASECCCLEWAVTVTGSANKALLRALPRICVIAVSPERLHMEFAAVMFWQLPEAMPPTGSAQQMQHRYGYYRSLPREDCMWN
jgi:hypothetical protein